MPENKAKPTNQENSENKKPTGTGGASKPWLTGPKAALILGSLFIVSAAVVVLVLALRGDGAESVVIEAPRIAGTPIVTADNLDTIVQETRERVRRGMFQTHMNTTWTFPDGYSPSTNAVMGNAANNNYPFWFTVTVQETDEVVFTSGLMPLGTQLSEITLDTPLPAGTYRAVVSINMIDDEGVPVDNNVGLGVTLIVQN